MGFNSAFEGLKIVKNPGNGRLNNLNHPVLNVLINNNFIKVLTLVSSIFYSTLTCFDLRDSILREPTDKLQVTSPSIKQYEASI